MMMKYSMCILVLLAGLSFSISEGVSSGHNLDQRTGSGLKRDGCGGRRRDSCNHYECQHNEDCQHCSSHQKPQCSNGQCHCKDCLDHSDCVHMHCEHEKTFYCSSSGHCHCEDRQCHSDFGCRHHHCRTGQIHSCSYGRCSCREFTTRSTTTTTTATPTTTTTKITTTPTTTLPTTTTTTTTLAPPTTPEPTTENHQLLMKCSTHTDCSSHVCQTGLHPYCSFGQRSSQCDCTVCTDESHCYCPAGLVGICHFNYFQQIYSCDCGFPPETTTQPKTTVTVKSTTQLPTTHILTSIQTKKQTTGIVQPSSQHQTTALPSTSDESTNPFPPTTAQHETNTSQPTTLAFGLRRCHVCGDNDNGIPCDMRSIYMGFPQQCGPGEDFCMTDLIHDGQQFPSIFKRCVTEDECRNKWLHQTSDLEHCTNYGNVLVEGHYSCHFCCTSDGCNSNQTPDKSTLYIKA